MSKTIRVAALDDAQQVLGIYAPFCLATPISFEIEAPSLEEIQRRIARTLDFFPWLICEASSGVVGYAYASRHRERAAYRWAADVSVYVREDSRGQGIGSALYNSLFAVLRLQRIFSVVAGITLPNPASVALHEAMGMLPVGLYPGIGFKCGKWHDVGWWQLELQPRPEDPPEPLSFPSIADRLECKGAIATGLALLKDHPGCSQRTSGKT
jgi:phosphinothricin acetyltransferase